MIDDKGVERLYVWTISPYGDGKKQIVWPRETEGKK